MNKLFDTTASSRWLAAMANAQSISVERERPRRGHSPDEIHARNDLLLAFNACWPELLLFSEDPASDDLGADEQQRKTLVTLVQSIVDSLKRRRSNPTWCSIEMIFRSIFESADVEAEGLHSDHRVTDMDLRAAMIEFSQQMFGAIYGPDGYRKLQDAAEALEVMISILEQWIAPRAGWVIEG